MSTSAVLQPAGPRSRRRQRWLVTAGRLTATALVAGAGLGALWRLLAPLARASVVDGGVYLEGHQELQVAQDGWLAVILALAGVLVATVQAVRAREPAHVHAVLAFVAVGIAGVVAWRVGEWLGPDSLRHQLAAGSQHPLTPLQLHTPTVPLVAPLLFAVTRCLASLLSRAEPSRG